MKKEEFLAISLPFGLKVDIIYNFSNPSKSTNLIGKDLDKENEYEVIPYCRPLSDITKEIEHNGEKFVPIDNIEGLFIEGTEDLINQSIEAIEYFIENNLFSRMEYLPFILIQKLIEWKFNLMDESEEFINVNDLDINPYK